MMIIEIPVTRTVDVRGRFWPLSRAVLSRALDEAEAGDVIAVWSRDEASRLEVPMWVEAAGHRVIGIEARDGYDEIFVERRR